MDNDDADVLLVLTHEEHRVLARLYTRALASSDLNKADMRLLDKLMFPQRFVAPDAPPTSKPSRLSQGMARLFRFLLR